MKNKFVVSVLLVWVLASCDWVDKIVCGEPTGVHQEFISNINKRYADTLTIAQVPCYPGYLRVHCKTAVADAVLDEIALSARKLGWIELLVYDKDNTLIRGETISM